MEPDDDRLVAARVLFARSESWNDAASAWTVLPFRE
jgi:hypothetical protein